MSSVGTSKGVLEIAKFAVYVSVPIGLMYFFAYDSKNIQKFMGNRSYVVYPPEAPRPQSPEELREVAREIARKRNSKLGFKRGKSHKNNATSRGAAKSQRTKDDIYSKTAQDTSDEEDVSEELSTVVSEEEVEEVEDTVYKEPSEYDNLLRRLGSGNESVANAYRRRLREEEGRSDTDDGSDSGSEEPDDDGDERIMLMMMIKEPTQIPIKLLVKEVMHKGQARGCPR